MSILPEAMEGKRMKPMGLARKGKGREGGGNKQQVLHFSLSPFLLPSSSSVLDSAEFNARFQGHFPPTYQCCQNMHDDSLAVALLNLNLAMKISREIDPNIHSRRLASLSRPRSSNEQSAKEATVVARRRRPMPCALRKP